MNPRLPIAALSLCAALCACGSGRTTPAPTGTPSKTLNVTLNDGSQGDLPWSAGAGTFALFAASPAVTEPIATSSVSADGTTSVVLPGSAEGIEAKTSTSPKTGLATLGVNCTATLSETAPTAQALYIGSAAFSSARGGAPISEYTATSTRVVNRYPVYVTQDDTVSGQLTCGGTIYDVALPFKRGWNVLAVISDTTGGASTVALDTSSTLHYAVR